MAKMFSDVSVTDFMKKVPIQTFQREGFLNVADQGEKLAIYQQMYYHAKAIRLRKAIQGDRIYDAAHFFHQRVRLSIP